MADLQTKWRAMAALPITPQDARDVLLGCADELDRAAQGTAGKPLEEVTEGITFYPQVKPGEEVFPQMQDYRMACCDCGLVHRMNFRVVEVVSQNTEEETYSVAEPANVAALRIVLTADRDDEETERIRAFHRHTCDVSDECAECEKDAVCQCGDMTRKGWQHWMHKPCVEVLRLVPADTAADQQGDRT